MCPVCIARTAVMVTAAGSTGGILAAGIGRFTKIFRASSLGLFQETNENGSATTDDENPKGDVAIKARPMVSEQEWGAVRQQLLFEEKGL